MPTAHLQQRKIHWPFVENKEKAKGGQFCSWNLGFSPGLSKGIKTYSKMLIAISTFEETREESERKQVFRASLISSDLVQILNSKWRTS